MHFILHLTEPFYTETSFFLFFSFFRFVYFERDTVWVGEGQREGERIPRRLHAQCRVWHGAGIRVTVRSWPEPKPRGHLTDWATQTPRCGTSFYLPLGVCELGWCGALSSGPGVTHPLGRIMLGWIPCLDLPYWGVGASSPRSGLTFRSNL